MTESPLLSERSRRVAGLICGPLIFLLILFSGSGILSWEARIVAGGTLWIIVWWVTEAVPIAAASLLPIVIFPLSGVMETGTVTAEYGNPIVFLFIGGFLIAIALEKWKVHTRIALQIISLIGTSPRQIIGGFLAATAFMSAWISNSATALMMLPVAAAVTTRFSPGEGDGEFRTALMLAVAYGASIGGIATLVGSPPNMIMAGMYSTLTGSGISFLEWSAFATPIAGILLLLTWIYLVFAAFPQIRGGETTGINNQIREIGPVSTEERRVLGVFFLTVALWITRAFWGSYFPMVTDAGIAVLGAVLLFLLPSGSGGRILVWEDAVRLPWSIVLLFGCGFALAKGFVDSGLESWMAGRLNLLVGVDPLVLLFFVIVMILFLTEVTSNTATATIFMPVAAVLATATGSNPLSLMAAAALASSLAFMLPVGTPPNAIVYGSGYVTMPHMVRAGFWMNLISIVVLMICIPLFIGRS
ncbi:MULTISPECIES: DASS family sodium-coupled anion symporter [unclassified Methanoregula]|uniref:SLC13 family permease n=1 Tax=unclassified Methanoregula TaxID=2649730 RepID=UPI0009CAC300|nr:MULTISPECIES: DASS family sodium-coupled anion symporter [unclassified Methanoregula]OPX64891.1 MAG: Sodium:sulfate symporter transmembrane region [Methanoregula sp. PtaB.Bin085]OPY32943.1 MAG: Sodium:sulfate symporter transmembrane region [Methanoregula sp. PtaU1.Bin006]